MHVSDTIHAAISVFQAVMLSLPSLAAWHLRRLSESGDLKERGKLVREVCAAIHEMLKAAGLASQDLRAHPHPLFRDHAALRPHIEDEQTITRK